MAEDTKGVRFGGAEEFGALSQARAALESVEQEHGRIERERRLLRDRFDGLLTSLRDGAVTLLFDADGELAGAEGPFDDHLGVSLSDLVTRFEDFAGDETRRALHEANNDVMTFDSSGVATSRGFLESETSRVGFTWVHLRRHDDAENLIGTEVIGLVSPTPAADEDVAVADDPFESEMQQVARRLLEDSADSTIQRAIESFGSSFAVDRVTINQYEEKDRAFSIMSSWRRGGIEPLAAETRGISISELPWAYSLLGAGEAVSISHHADLPAEARAEKRIYAADGVKSSLLVPMVRDDHLFGFVSIQSVHQDRNWSATDVANASGFVRLLSATLARAEVEDELAEARRETEAAVERAQEAEARADEAEGRAKESGEKHEALSAEAVKARRRIEELERDLQTAHEAEKKAQATADEERDRAEEVRKESEDLRKETKTLADESEDLRKEAEELRKKADDARRELDELKRDAERAERSAEDNAADMRTLRRELDDARKHAEQVREEARESRRLAHEMPHDVASVRADDRGVRPLDLRGSGAGRQATAKLASVDDRDPEVKVEMPGGDRRGFDPDATIEMEFSGLGKRGLNSAPGLASKIAQFADPDATVEVAPREHGDDLQDGLTEVVDLDDALELSGNGSGMRPSPKEFLETSSIENKAEMAPPRWLRAHDTDEDVADEADHDRAEPDRDADNRAEQDRDADNRAAHDFEDDETPEVEREVAAARTVARRAAGRDDEVDTPDWWGVGGDDDRAGDARDGEEVDDGKNVEADALDRDGEGIFVEAAWNRRSEGADEMAEWDTEPPASSAPFASNETDTSGEHEEIESEAGEDDALVRLPDLAGIDSEIGLQDVGGNVELYRSLLCKFRNDYIGAASKIDNAIEKGNIEVAHLLLHAIKGVSGILGAMPLREAADNLETRLIGGDPGATRAAVDDFTRALNGVLDSIATLDEAPPVSVADIEEASTARASNDDESGEDEDVDDEPESAVSDPMVLRSYLSGLRQHLLAEKPRQCQLVMREIGARRWPTGFDTKVTELGELIDDGSFAGARDVFEELMVMFDD